jgi:uncharacterized RDD family membrane protein YckC
MPTPAETSNRWPGEQFGLPEQGSRSVARMGRRILALILDWAIATGVSFLIVHKQDAWITLAAFAVLQVVFIATLSGSIGHLVLGMRVVPLDPKWIGVLKPAIRTVLVCLVIPAVIFDKDQRGLHDKIAGTVLVRR